jgi:hypothetical protein
MEPTQAAFSHMFFADFEFAKNPPCPFWVAITKASELFK